MSASQLSKVPNLEGYLVWFLWLCKLGAKNEGYLGEGYPYHFILSSYLDGF